jgi:anti-sigma B factor antagonist
METEDRLRLTSYTTNGLTVIVASGDVDADNAASLTIAITDALGTNRRVEVDLSEITFIDSSGLRDLVDARQAAAHRFRVGPMSSTAKRIIEISGLTDYLTS